MTDQGSSSAVNMSRSQKKRVAVACQRCRRMKRGCSGNLGEGQPCTNCKNASVEQCLFFRVSSRDIALKPNTSSDNAMSPASLNYGQHPGAVGIGGLPGTAEHPLMAQDGRGYACGRHQAPPPTSHNQDFPATATYAPAPNSYDDPTAVGVGRQFTNYTAAGYSPVHAMPHEIVGMVPSWSSRKTTPCGGDMDSAPESYGGYGSPNLVRCPAPHSGAHHGHGTHTTEFQSPSFSFSGAASLPITNTGYGGFDEVDTVASSRHPNP